MANFLTLPIFQDIILPFVLIFTLVFAILEKSRLLGEDKHQINAIISLVIAAILISFSAQIAWIKQFVLFLIIALVILFVFMLIYGFVYAGKEGFQMGSGLKITLAAIAFVAVVIGALVITDTWSKVYDLFTSSTVGANIIFIVIIAAAIVAVLFGKKEK